MTQSFGQTIPDMIGFVVVGATAGAMLTGGADAGLTIQSVIGCLSGGLIGPALLMTSWTRLLRVRWIKRAVAAHG